MDIERIDHIVLTVADIETTVAFYTGVLGMHLVNFGNGRKALAFGNQKINLHQKGKEIDPKAARPTPGSADLCFTTTTDIGDVEKQLIDRNIEIVAGKVEQEGALGKMQSVYFRDPDGNLVEVSNYY